MSGSTNAPSDDNANAGESALLTGIANLTHQQVLVNREKKLQPQVVNQVLSFASNTPSRLN